MNTLEAQLLGSLNEFTAFARKRLSDPELAADAVQDSLLKAIQAAAKNQPIGNVKAWFYRILRHTIIDLYRRQDARERALALFERELPDSPGVEEDHVTCACLGRLIPTLKPEYSEVLQLLDLEGYSTAEAASRLSTNENNVKVRLHRARKRLREQLVVTCKLCAKHGCLNCTCNSGKEGSC
ncbi:MAG: sigma-70 family RNA polymerase sigma factor [Candidatus Hydrogenedens sp.]|nr:sigma-70 family RNA polymerase sigma factor [Candidatus Hydrogenedens sp.]